MNLDIFLPCFDLSVGEVEFGCELHSVLNAEILLSLKAVLQSLELVIYVKGAISFLLDKTFIGQTRRSGVD